ncbi:GNAT family N-acetyltransferase [Amnibacterium sp. CER49]|uniref:GNAT family N-acetyltransferase n=1 Tax=Amnibacterium sp. CER49 TaxID=3039161 RepID=UPI00244813EE|nr:GNAT family N-acetyltransferase [Amnibacterium sp. CER49]MDH2445157.1 GNAT family N-acetyltransferase [Amnibacterium sp. CER49]
MTSAQVRPMTQVEFEMWQEHEVEAYAVDIAEASGVPLDEARRRSATQTAELLPDGLRTAGAHLLRILDAEGGPVGVLWVGPHPRRPAAGWVYDIEIDEERRGQGFGRAAMLAAEAVAADEGWTAIGLNVFGRNVRARALYESLGYAVDSLQMTKVLGG